MPFRLSALRSFKCITYISIKHFQAVYPVVCGSSTWCLIMCAWGARFSSFRFCTTDQQPINQFQNLDYHNNCYTSPEIESSPKLGPECCQWYLRSNFVLQHALPVKVHMYFKKVSGDLFSLRKSGHLRYIPRGLVTEKSVMMFIRTARYVFLIVVIMVWACRPGSVGDLK